MWIREAITNRRSCSGTGAYLRGNWIVTAQHMHKWFEWRQIGMQIREWEWEWCCAWVATAGSSGFDNCAIIKQWCIVAQTVVGVRGNRGKTRRYLSEGERDDGAKAHDDDVPHQQRCSNSAQPFVRSCRSFDLIGEKVFQHTQYKAVVTWKQSPIYNAKVQLKRSSNKKRTTKLCLPSNANQQYMRYIWWIIVKIHINQNKQI